jgi:hypothetical protein
MKQVITILILAFIVFTGITTKAQTRNFSFFGSYNRSFGFLTGKLSSDLQYPYYDEVKKLTSGNDNQFELGTFYKSFGLGIIYNTYVANATTSYDSADVNSDAHIENGVLSDDLKLKFTGLELLYKHALFNSRFDACWKVALGMQSYTLKKYTQILGTYPYEYSQKISGNIFTTLLGMEINYHVWKMIRLGVEASLIPGNYNKLELEGSDATSKDNVSRLNTGLRITIIL